MKNRQEIHPWHKVLVPPQGIYLTISFSFSAELKLRPGLPRRFNDKETACQCRGEDLWVRKNSEKEMAAHSSILACEILWTEELEGCRPWSCKRVGQDLVNKQQQKPQVRGRMATSGQAQDSWSTDWATTTRVLPVCSCNNLSRLQTPMFCFVWPHCIRHVDLHLVTFPSSSPASGPQMDTSLLETGPHSRRWAVAKCKPSPPPCLWENCLPQNWALAPKRLGTTVDWLCQANSGLPERTLFLHCLFQEAIFHAHTCQTGGSPSTVPL